MIIRAENHLLDVAAARHLIARSGVVIEGRVDDSGVGADIDSTRTTRIEAATILRDLTPLNGGRLGPSINGSVEFL